MEITEGDFLSWLDNPVTRAVRKWAEREQNNLGLEVAEAISDGAIVSIEEQHIRHGKSEVYLQIYELGFEDINDSQDIANGEE